MVSLIVAGSVALLFAGLRTPNSSIGGIPKRQFGEILRYDDLIKLSTILGKIKPNKTMTEKKCGRWLSQIADYRESIVRPWQGNTKEKRTESVTLMVTDKGKFWDLYFYGNPRNQAKANSQGQLAVVSNEWPA